MKKTIFALLFVLMMSTSVFAVDTLTKSNFKRTGDTTAEVTWTATCSGTSASAVFDVGLAGYTADYKLWKVCIDGAASETSDTLTVTTPSGFDVTDGGITTTSVASEVCVDALFVGSDILTLNLSVCVTGSLTIRLLYVK